MLLVVLFIVIVLLIVLLIVSLRTCIPAPYVRLHGNITVELAIGKRWILSS